MQRLEKIRRAEWGISEIEVVEQKVNFLQRKSLTKGKTADHIIEKGVDGLKF